MPQVQQDYYPEDKRPMEEKKKKKKKDLQSALLKHCLEITLSAISYFS